MKIVTEVNVKFDLCGQEIGGQEIGSPFTCQNKYKISMQKTFGKDLEKT